MINLTLVVVLSQLSSPPLVPGDAARPAAVASETPVPASMGHGWMIATPIVAAVGGAISAQLIAFQATQYTSGLSPSGWDAPAGPQIAVAVVGAVIGSGLGLLAGYFAQRGSMIARAACIAIYALSTVAVGLDLTTDSWRTGGATYSGGGGWGW